jgi:electron-transferring-flavoprotein dehydrogenase
MHTLGWPLSNDTGGGAFCYHLEDSQLSIGFVVHLNYKNPYLSPYDEFQKFKHHPKIERLLTGGNRISYGARVITEGGLQSIPKLVFPGGALIGCSAGFVNVPRIKGSHNAMKSGMLAAESAYNAIVQHRHHDELTDYPQMLHKSWVYKDLYKVRNVKPLISKLGTLWGLILGGIDMWMNSLGIGIPITLKHGQSDADTLISVNKAKKISYPKPDNVISFDKLSSVFISNTNHAENQPVHLKLADDTLPIDKNLPIWGEPAQLYCPAGVYEIVENKEKGHPEFQINAQNCVHCKTCDIKDPSHNITWSVPQGGDGPNYPNM